MNRREFLKSGAAAGTLIITGSYATPVRAIPPPILIVLVGVAIRVAFKRYVVDAIMATLGRLLPFFFATELRKYLMAVAVAFGMSEAEAAVVAEHAENSGADDLARDGVERFVDLFITNNQDEPLELPRLNLLLVDVATNTVELRSSTSWGLVVNPNLTMHRQIVSNRFPRTGLKQWYLSDMHKTLAVSKPFMVVV